MQITAVINFAVENHTKDISKYKSVLMAAKAKNVPVH